MRAVIGHDGSPSSDDAVRLAAALPWPLNTELTLVRVGPRAGHASGREALAAIASSLAAPGRSLRTVVRAGRPASVLAEVAAQRKADLLLLGWRGFSTIRSLLLGSVSAELVERAPCSVLVARGSGHERLVVGTDGSAVATGMPRILCAWELFRGATAIVVGVTGSAAADGEPRGLALATRRLAARLATCGLRTSDRVLSGDPATMLIDVAGREGAHLLVVGPRGRSRIAELMLGSVARNVAQHAGCSVLVVRPRAGAA